MSRRIARGIYARPSGFDARATVNGVTRFKSYPLGTPVKVMKAWQESERTSLRKERPSLTRGTFTADVSAYLARPEVATMPFLPNRTAQLLWWVERLGPKRRMSVTVADVQDGLSALLTAGRNPAYVEHFRVALVALWRALDGKQAYCPAKDVENPSKGQRSPVRAIPEDVLATILDSLPSPDTCHSARIRVLAATGLPPALLSKMRSEDVDLERATVRVHPRHKGAGVDGRILPITRAAVEAFAVLMNVGMVPFSTTTLSGWFGNHCRKHGIKGVRLYDLRHTYLTRILSQTGSLEAVQGLAMHANLRTSQHYTRGAVPAILAAAVETLNQPTVH